MGCIIITIPKSNMAKRLREIIKRNGIWEEVVLCSKGSETIRAVKKLDASVVICSQKFSDMGYEELSCYLPQAVKMILLTKEDSGTLFSGNIIKLKMPFRGEELLNILHGILSLAKNETKKKPKKRSKEEQEVIDQAKELLIRKNNMSEPDAFRYIQKNSMDMGRNMVDTAWMIIRMNQ